MFSLYNFAGTVNNFLKVTSYESSNKLRTSNVSLLRIELILIIVGVIEIVWKEALWRRLKVQGDLQSQIPAEWDARRSRYLVLEMNATDR